MTDGCEVPLEVLARLAARWCPVFRLHPDDRFLPCTAGFFLRHSALRTAGGAVVAPRGALDERGAALLAAQAARPGERLWLDLDPAARRGAPADRLDDVPVYAHAKAVVGPDGRVEAFEVTYITLYAHNGSYTVLPGLRVGAHDGDVEHVTARCDARTGGLLGVWYNSHRSRDGEWVPGARVPRDAGGRPVAYVALHGHGVYPKPGTHHRHFYLGNDRCSGRGPAWRPRRVVLLPNVHAPPRVPGAADVPVDAAPAGGGAPAAASRRVLPHCPSRGSLLRASTALPLEEGGGGGGGGGGGALPEVDADDPCEWLWFIGKWGTVDPPILQSWFHSAETPESRTPLLRLFGHFYPETQKV